MAGKAGCVNPALTECPYSSLPRMTLGTTAVSKAPSLNAATRRKLFSSSLQLNLNCVRQDQSVENPLLRPLGDCEDSYIQMISARTPLIEAESDRESCVWTNKGSQRRSDLWIFFYLRFPRFPVKFAYQWVKKRAVIKLENNNLQRKLTTVYCGSIQWNL